MKHRAWLLALIILFLPTWIIGADNDQQTTGNQLLIDCGAAISSLDGEPSKPYNPMGMGFCIGLMTGIVHTNQLSKEPLFCAPENITMGQAARITLKYLRDHPEELHIKSSILALYALREAFPCKNRN